MGIILFQEGRHALWLRVHWLRCKCRGVRLAQLQAERCPAAVGGHAGLLTCRARHADLSSHPVAAHTTPQEVEAAVPNEHPYLGGKVCRMGAALLMLAVGQRHRLQRHFGCSLSCAAARMGAQLELL